jgi:galactokinase
VRSEHVPQFRDLISTEYKNKTGRTPEIYVSRPAAGAEEISTSNVALEA